MGSALLALVLAASVSGCSAKVSSASSGSMTSVQVTMNGDKTVDLNRDGDGPLTGTAFGVEFRFEGVDLQMGSATVSGSVSIRVSSPEKTNDGQLMVQVEGHDAEMREGVFFLGETSYGSVDKGDSVVVTPDGVAVNGEHRGSLPGN